MVKDSTESLTSEIDDFSLELVLVQSKRMEAYFDKAEFSDLDLTLRDPTGNIKTLSAHRVVLAGNSEFFRTLLSTSQFREAGQRQITVEVPVIDEALQLIGWMYNKNPFFPQETITLAQQWLVLGALVEDKIPYPGNPGTFVYLVGSWEMTPQPHRSHQDIRFRSVTPNSTIGQLIVQNYPPYGFRVGIEFVGASIFQVSSNNDLKSRDKFAYAFQKYLAQYGIQVGEIYLLMGSYYTGTAKEAQTLLDIVLKHNTFTQKDRDLLEGIL